MGPKRSDKSARKAFVKKTAEVVSRVEAITLTELRWAGDPIPALRELLAAEEELIAAQGDARGLEDSARPWRERWEALCAWLDDEGVDHSAVRLERFGEQGSGLVAERDLREGELFVQVPRKVMITADLALGDRDLEVLFRSDPLLRRVESLALALCVLRERLTPDSRFRAYLDVFPSEFHTPLWFNLDEVLALRGTSAFEKSVARIRGNARQYCHLYNAIKGGGVASIPPSQFTFARFKWAVSVVMTRQNMIPCNAGEGLALIPLWDMINHVDGEYSTQFNVEKDAVECFAMQAVPRNHQVLMFYGPRPNAELLVHSGFVYEGNSHDRVELVIDLDTSDELFRIRRMLLEKRNVEFVETLLDSGGARVIGRIDRQGVPSSDVLTCSRILTMARGEITTALRNLADLGATEPPEWLPPEAEQRALAWTRSLLEARLAGYPKEASADALAASLHLRLAHDLRRCEQGILARALERVRATSPDDSVR